MSDALPQLPERRAETRQLAAAETNLMWFYTNAGCQGFSIFLSLPLHWGNNYRLVG